MSSLSPFGLRPPPGLRRHPLSRTYSRWATATFYQWKAKYGGLDASDLKRLKELEHENGRLKKMFAELSLENHALKDLIDRKL